MSTIINYFKNDGTLVVNDCEDINDLDFDYAQVALLGEHAETTTEGNIMLVSKYDVPAVKRFRWYLAGSGYPATYGTYDETIKFSRPVPLHQLMHGKLAPGYVVDHINRNKLDNRRENLRICTAVQNSYNKSKPKNSAGKYKGVTKNGKKNPTFTASITKDGVKREIKDIPTEEQAARVYDMMAEELFGPYAAKNFTT